MRYSAEAFASTFMKTFSPTRVDYVIPISKPYSQWKKLSLVTSVVSIM